MVPVNYLAVVVAAVANMVLGFLWYGPAFGKIWVRLSGMSQDKMVSAKAKGMSTSYIVMFIGSLLMGYVLAHAIIFADTYLNTAGIAGGIMVGFWNWLGFIAPVTVGVVLWEGKPWKLWALTNGYYLIALVLMGSILAVWQ